jgi:protein gp37
VFVNSMSDLFHEDVPDEFIDRAFAVMALAAQHTFQILTKRAERMRDYMVALDRAIRIPTEAFPRWRSEAEDILSGRQDFKTVVTSAWPLPNVWLGVSVENQHFADERIPLLLKTPAAVRFISAEPLLGPVHLDDGCHSWLSCMSAMTDEESEAIEGRGGYVPDCCESFQTGEPHFHGIDWVIVGGESGPGARPFDVSWARSIVHQCKTAGVPVFVKQLGARPHGDDGSDRPNMGNVLALRSRKGGDMSEWPDDLRVRQFPEPA